MRFSYSCEYITLLYLLGISTIKTTYLSTHLCIFHLAFCSNPTHSSLVLAFLLFYRIFVDAFKCLFQVAGFDQIFSNFHFNSLLFFQLYLLLFHRKHSLIFPIHLEKLPTDLIVLHFLKLLIEIVAHKNFWSTSSLIISLLNFLFPLKFAPIE